MHKHKVYRAIGLMSGTSLDGFIDVALIETDGHDFVRPLEYLAYPYDVKIREKVRKCFGKTELDEQTAEAEKLVTDAHVMAVKALGQSADIIGFHGQTITHDPDNRFTWQLGDGQALATGTVMDVICDMRQNDIKAGGQGAPLLPLYHKALLGNNKRGVAILNLGGVANITYIGSSNEVIAFDCGPANALMDDFIKLRRGLAFDDGGSIASLGQPLNNVLQSFISDEYFSKIPPKSLDRDNWSIDDVRYASTEDGLATLLEMTISGIKSAVSHLPEKPSHIYVAGGGRKNTFLIASLAERLALPFTPIDDLGWNGDAIEAQGFAYLAVRSKLGLPITLPSTTGVPEAITGGALYKL